MYYKGLTWKFKLLLMSSCLAIGPLVLLLFYREHGRLPLRYVASVIIACLLGCLFIVIGDRSWRKYYMSKESTREDSDEQ